MGFVNHHQKFVTERPSKTKIDTEVAHVTRDSDTTFKDKRSRSQGRGHIVAAPAQLVNSLDVQTSFLNFNKTFQHFLKYLFCYTSFSWHSIYK